MPRHSYTKNLTKDDPMYDSHEVAKLINYIMVDGKKSIARGHVYSMMESLKKQGKDPMDVLSTAIANVAPTHEVKPRRLGGASYLVPTEVRRERKLFLALNWIVEAARSRSNKEYRSFQKKLESEILEAASNQGQAVAKRAQTEKLADANKAFSHLKW